MKNSTRHALETVLQVIAGFAAATPVVMLDAGISSEVGAGATVLAVAALVTKLMKLADDTLDDFDK